MNKKQTHQTGPSKGEMLKSAEDLIMGELDEEWAKTLEKFGRGERWFSHIMADAATRVSNGRGDPFSKLSCVSPGNHKIGDISEKM